MAARTVEILHVGCYYVSTFNCRPQCLSPGSEEGHFSRGNTPGHHRVRNCLSTYVYAPFRQSRIPNIS